MKSEVNAACMLQQHVSSCLLSRTTLILCAPRAEKLLLPSSRCLRSTEKSHTRVKSCAEEWRLHVLKAGWSLALRSVTSGSQGDQVRVARVSVHTSHHALPHIPLPQPDRPYCGKGSLAAFLEIPLSKIGGRHYSYESSPGHWQSIRNPTSKDCLRAPMLKK